MSIFAGYKVGKPSRLCDREEGSKYFSHGKASLVYLLSFFIENSRPQRETTFNIVERKSVNRNGLVYVVTGERLEMEKTKKMAVIFSYVTSPTWIWWAIETISDAYRHNFSFLVFALSLMESKRKVVWTRLNSYIFYKDCKLSIRSNRFVDDWDYRVDGRRCHLIDHVRRESLISFHGGRLQKMISIRDAFNVVVFSFIVTSRAAYIFFLNQRILTKWDCENFSNWMMGPTSCLLPHGWSETGLHEPSLSFWINWKKEEKERQVCNSVCRCCANGGWK